ncbi:polysaccharide synthesis protein exod [Roseobacter denitrificans]|nr:exopolysaccharide biosynthesis protein [Roseobacter denitrificans]AVL51551.1 polysaccharide synthesis protein exod [Roseobacter denitrificans]SFG36433.1 Uncharacterized conserved protein [Roseobacter denitrificans OCh 114]
MSENDLQTQFTDTIDRVSSISEHGDTTTIGEVTKAVGGRSHLTVILLAAALASTPLSGIPGLATVCGLIIALSSAQALCGRDRVRLPKFLSRKSLNNDSLSGALSFLRKCSSFLDNHTAPRFDILVTGPARTLLFSFFLIGGLLMPVLELIPFSSSIMAATIAFFSIAAVSRDGLWAAMGILTIGTCATMLVWLV